MLGGLAHIQLEALGYVVLAMFLGAVIGFERELAGRPAGLRTHMLVAGATALFTALGIILLKHYDFAMGHDSFLRSDPIRIIEAVVTGVSFLGAGTIIHSSDRKVEGLTTAASILLAAAVGLSVALSQGILAVGVTLLTVLTLRGLKVLQKRMHLH